MLKVIGSLAFGASAIVLMIIPMIIMGIVYIIAPRAVERAFRWC